MDLRWPLLGAILLVVVAAAVGGLVWLGRRDRSRPLDVVLVAHTARLRRLPRFRELARQQSWLAWWQTVAVVVALLGSIWLIARPQTTDITQNRHSTRDIVLCLDASLSMFDEDTEVTQAYAQLVSRLDGERVSLVLWSDAAVTIFPLTDDYAFVQNELTHAGREFSQEESGLEYADGTFLNKRASQIGDGIASCVKHFDFADTTRGRAVIVASDNGEKHGRPVFTLPQAAAFAKQHDVKVFGIGSPDLTFEPKERAEFKDAVTATGGTFSILGENGSVDSILDGIDQLTSDEVVDPPQYHVRDARGWPTAVVVLGIVMLGAGWVYAYARSAGARQAVTRRTGGTARAKEPVR